MSNPVYHLTVAKLWVGENYHIDKFEYPYKERFESYGAMMLWAQQWFKTTGANRAQKNQTKRIVANENVELVKNYKNWKAKQYAEETGSGNWLNLYRSEDFSQFTEENFLHGYRHWFQNGLKWNQVNYPGNTSLPENRKYQPYGMLITSIYQKYPIMLELYVYVEEPF